MDCGRLAGDAVAVGATGNLGAPSEELRPYDRTQPKGQVGMACCELRADLPPSQPRVLSYGSMAVAQDAREGTHTLDLRHKETSLSKVSLRSETEIKAGMM